MDNEFQNFDPDQFDWDGDVNPDMGAYDSDIVEAAIAAALALHEDSFGWTHVRESELRERARKLFHVKVVMPKEHRGWFEETWPEYLFVWDKASIHHDHPRSHLATELNEMEVVGELLSRDIPYVDLFGNPGRNAKYKRPCLTLYEKKCARDYVRLQHADKFPRSRRLDWDMLVRGGYSVGHKRIHDVVNIHSLYYLGLDKVGEYCNAHEKNRMHCVVHRHPESSGTLNAGELEYVVSEKGVVTQKNVLTGEYYEHPSVEALFHQFSCQTKFGGLAWTVRKLGGDSFLIEFVGCPNDICKEYVPFSYLKPETRFEETVCNVTVRRFLHYTWTTHVRGGRSVSLTDAGLLTKLRRYQSGRPRGPRQKTELHNYAKRLVNKEDIIALHGGGCHEVDTGDITDYVEAAFYMDVRHELEVAISYYRENQNLVKAINKYMSDGVLPTSVVLPTQAISYAVDAVVASVKSSVYPVHALARQFERAWEPGAEPTVVW